MPKKTITEYVGAKRRAYTGLKNKEAKNATINGFCAITEADHKYAIGLLNSNRRCHEHKGHSKIYRSDSKALLLHLWRTSEQMAPQYLVTVAQWTMDTPNKHDFPQCLRCPPFDAP